MEWVKVENSAKEDGYIAIWQSKPLGLWNLGVYPVIFGVRVVAWREGSFGRSVDYCAGDSQVFLLELLLTIKQILSKVPEEITEVEVEEMMPQWQTRPISQDLQCWSSLRELASCSP